MSCQQCFHSGPTAYVELRHNVGMLFTRQEYATTGSLCRSCLHRAFARHMLGNLALGWWGTISFFMTWYFLATNIARYVGALRELGGTTATRAANAPFEVPTAEAEERLTPFTHNVRLRLKARHPVEEIARDLSASHHVQLADARRFVEGVTTAS